RCPAFLANRTQEWRYELAALAGAIPLLQPVDHELSRRAEGADALQEQVHIQARRQSQADREHGLIGQAIAAGVEGPQRMADRIEAAFRFGVPAVEFGA